MQATKSIGLGRFGRAVYIINRNFLSPAFDVSRIVKMVALQETNFILLSEIRDMIKILRPPEFEENLLPIAAQTLLKRRIT